MKEYITIDKNTETQFIEKKSKFISNIFYIENIEEAERYIEQTNKKYNDATHNCFAYRFIKDGSLIEKASDNGEPQGTAGLPILNILQKNELVNVIIIVTRYFGGIMLGAGGLVRAYSEAAKQSVLNTQKVRNISGEEIEIIIDYSEFEKFKYYCKKLEINIDKVEYLEHIVCRISVEILQKQRLEAEMKIKNIKIVNFNKIREKYIKISILK